MLVAVSTHTEPLNNPTIRLFSLTAEIQVELEATMLPQNVEVGHSERPKGWTIFQELEQV